jgi:hypothetical protein
VGGGAKLTVEMVGPHSTYSHDTPNYTIYPSLLQSGGNSNMWYSWNYGAGRFVSINTETDWDGAEEEGTGDSHIPSPTHNPSIVVVGARKEATLPKKYWSPSYQSFSFVGPACPPLRSCKEGSTSFHYSPGLLTSTPNSGEAAVLFHPGLGHPLGSSC